MHTRSIILAERPRGLPQASNFRLVERELPPLAEGQFLIANELLSMDAGVRAFLDESSGYLETIAINAPVRGMSLSRIVESRNPAFEIGTMLRSFATWSDFSIVDANEMGLDRVVVHPRLRPEIYMGALGPVGLTAWIGMHEIGKIRPGDTVLVSAAAGATGSIAAQIARHAGCHVVGIAGSPEKIRRLADIGIDATVDYRANPDLAEAIRAHCPGGVDVFFDNVGGEMLETVLPLMREHGRVVVCGMIAEYNNAGPAYGVKTLWQIVAKRLTLRGFLTFDHAELLPRAAAELEAMALQGSLRAYEEVYDGLENAPKAFIDLMAGRTLGKTLVRVKAATPS